MHRQAFLVIDHCNRYGSIEAVEAFELYGIKNLAASISEIRKSGLYFCETIRDDFDEDGKLKPCYYVVHRKNEMKLN